MKSYIVISGSGPDRVGLVDEISGFLVANQLNIEDSRMAVLGGEFALILLVSGEDAQVNWLAKNINLLVAQTGLNLNERKTRAPGERQVELTLGYKLVVTGMDHPGIVREFTKILNTNHVNIESMETKVVPAPLSGTPVFNMECRLTVPASLKIAGLKSALNQAADSENLDWVFEPV